MAEADGSSGFGQADWVFFGVLVSMEAEGEGQVEGVCTCGISDTDGTSNLLPDVTPQGLR
jgi:hypothetical protein